MKKSAITIIISLLVVILMFWQNMVLRNRNADKDKKINKIEQKLVRVYQQANTITNNNIFYSLPPEFQQATKSIIAISSDSAVMPTKEVQNAGGAE